MTAILAGWNLIHSSLKKHIKKIESRTLFNERQDRVISQWRILPVLPYFASTHSHPWPASRKALSRGRNVPARKLWAFPTCQIIELVGRKLLSQITWFNTLFLAPFQSYNGKYYNSITSGIHQILHRSETERYPFVSQRRRPTRNSIPLSKRR